MNKEKIEKECWYDNFENPEQYVGAKLDMLRNDMCINPTLKEIDHLYMLKTQSAIDNAVHSIIDRHWS